MMLGARMDDEAAKIILREALEKLKKELNTFGKMIGERPIMFRIAHYMATKVEREDVTVDCDYNRHGDDFKTFPIPRKIENGLPEQARFFPDIVLHNRRVDTQNILVCEIKRASDGRSHDVDHSRLTMLTDQTGGFRYRLGAFIEVDQKNRAIKLLYFKNGKKQGEPISV